MISTEGFNEVIHSPHRLRICVMLAAVDSMMFSAIREELDVSDSTLSKQLSALSDSDYVKLSKPTGTGGRPVTWVSLTQSGRKALHQHLAALERLAAIAQSTAADSRIN